MRTRALRRCRQTLERAASVCLYLIDFPDISALTLNYPVVVGCLAISSVAAAAWSLTTGSIDIPYGEIVGALFDATGRDATIVRELRWPRTLGGFVAGALLAMTGTVLQVLLRNPLADPYILGVSGGAAVAALWAILLGAGAAAIMGAAAGGAAVASLLVFTLAYGRGVWSSTRLLLTGVVMASGWGALTSFLLSISQEQQLYSMLFWLMGDLSGTRPGAASAIVLIVGIAVCVLNARNMNLMSGGELRAQFLGVPIDQVRVVLFLCASVFTATAVVLAGTIGFVGLVVPHIIRLIAGGDHRGLVPASALAGGTLVVFADTVARTALAPHELPVGVITALIGVPVFLLLLRKTLAGGAS